MSASTCEKVQRLLSPYLDRRLPPKTARSMSLHLATCEVCRRERDALERLSKIVSELPLEHPTPGVAARVRDSERASSGWTLTIRYGHVAAALLISVSLAGAYALGRWQGRPAAPAPVQVPAEEEVAQATPEPVEVELAQETPEPVEVELAQATPEPAPPEPRALRPVTGEPLLPDRTALRAARAIFADLELLDAVPEPLHEPMLRAQVERYDLARWAEVQSIEPALSAVAQLIQRLDREIDDGLRPAELAVLREEAARPGLWGSAFAAAGPAEPRTRDLDELLDAYADHFSPATRHSLGEWVSYKDEWIRGEQDLDSLLGLIDHLGPAIDTTQITEFILPDLGDLYERIEWSEDGDGVRHGSLEIERKSGNGGSSLRVKFRSHSSSSSSSSSSSEDREEVHDR